MIRPSATLTKQAKCDTTGGHICTEKLKLTSERKEGISRNFQAPDTRNTYLICQCSEYDDSRASIELSYGSTGAAPVNWTPENTNTPASKIVSAETESIMPLYLIAG